MTDAAAADDDDDNDGNDQFWCWWHWQLLNFNVDDGYNKTDNKAAFLTVN